MFRIGKTSIGNGNPTYIVAEAGNNHNGDFEMAKKLIQKASECGANAIKFQTIIANEFFSKNIDSKLFKYAEKISLNEAQYIKLKKYAKKNNIEFFSTVFGYSSVKLLKNVGVNVVKIASSDLTNFELLEDASKLKVPIIISTGMSSISEIASAIEFIQKYKLPFALLHCISSYPTSLKDANLSTIPYLHQTFHVPIGYSDHTKGIEACLAAVSLGASIIEKHFTLDKNMDVPDKAVSADPRELIELVSKIKNIEIMRGHPRMIPFKPENKFKKLMRKSIAATVNIPAQTKIKKSMLTIIRPGTGIPPNMMNQIVGLTTKKPIKEGTLINWDSF
jgi:N-acetylneuraminate synthase/N,N'-diacetyllegionaminate synthase